MKCLKTLACTMLVSMAVVCAADDEASEKNRQNIVFNSKDHDQLTACIDALEMMMFTFTSVVPGQALNALKVQDLPEAIRLLTIAATDHQMGILPSILLSVQSVYDNYEAGQSDDEEDLDEEAIYAELDKRQQLLDKGYVVTKSGEVIDFAELNRRNAQNAADNFAGDDSEQEEA